MKGSLIRVKEEIPIATGRLRQQPLGTGSDTCSTCKIDKVTRWLEAGGRGEELVPRGWKREGLPSVKIVCVKRE